MANYLVVIHGCIEPEIIGPIGGRIDLAIIKQIRENPELGPDGLDMIFLLEIPDRGPKKGIPEMTALSGACMKKLRSRAEKGK